MSSPDLLYLIGGLALIVALVVPTLISQVAISSPIVLLGIGIAIGLSPLAEGLSPDPLADRAVIEHVTELTVLVALMGVGLAIDRPLELRSRAVWATWSPTWRLLAVGMPLTIAGVALLGVLAGLAPAIALLLGAVLAPTDPVLASDVQVEGPNVEDAHDRADGEGPKAEETSEVRFALTSEAALNDGLAFPFVHLAMMLATGSSFWAIAGEWVAIDVLFKVAAGCLAGYAVGSVLGRLAFRSRSEAMRVAERGDPLLALAALLTAYGVGEALHGYGFLSVVICAIVMRATERHHHIQRGMHELTERLELLLTLLVLLCLGCAIGDGLLASLTWSGALIGVALVFVVRPLAGWLSIALAPRDAAEPGGMNPRERAVVAFFGVRGVGSLFYLAFALGTVKTDHDEWLWATVAFTIVLSVVVHGVLATPVMRRVEAQQHN